MARQRARRIKTHAVSGAWSSTLVYSSIASAYFPSFSNSNPSKAGPNFDCRRKVSTAAFNLALSSPSSTSRTRDKSTSCARRYWSDSAKQAASNKTLSVVRSNSTKRRERAIAPFGSLNSASGPPRERNVIKNCKSFTASAFSVEIPWEIAFAKSDRAASSSSSLISQNPRRIRIQGISGAFCNAAVYKSFAGLQASCCSAEKAWYAIPLPNLTSSAASNFTNSFGASSFFGALSSAQSTTPKAHPQASPNPNIFTPQFIC